MHHSGVKQQFNARSRRHRFIVGILMGAIAVTLPVTGLPGMAQNLTASPSPKPSILDIPKQLGNFQLPLTSPEIATGEVRLDGRKLFAITAPAVQNQNKQKDSTTPIQDRIQTIETILNRLANSALDLKQLAVTSDIDAKTGLPIVSVNDQYLMTVTNLDAQIQGRDPERQAAEIVRTVKEALVRARQERQTNFLTRQSLTGSAILIAMVLSSWMLAQSQRRLKAEHDRLRSQDLLNPDPLATVNATNLGEGSSSPLQVTAAVRRLLSRRQQRNLTDIRRRFLQLTQASIWGAGAFIILGLFPYTRWLQPLVLSTPLQVLSVGLITYVLIRISSVLIDHFLGVLEEGEFLSAESSQRVNLRVSTFSRVFKSLAAVFLTGVGIISALSIVGVELAPVLAGAGLVGIVLSFASQSLLKDMINGLLIVFEDQYAVGDVIAVGNVSGLVEYMNLRITQIRNAEGRLITIPNSSIAVVENLSKDWSRVDLAIAISNGTDVNQAVDVITQVGQEIMNDPHWQTRILESPEVLGIDEISNAGFTVRVWIKTQPLQQWNVAREFRRRLKLALDQQGISITMPQQSTWFKGPIDLEEKVISSYNGQKLQPIAGRPEPSK